MGLVHANIILSNPRIDADKPIEIQALVDTGARMLYIPQHIALQLKLDELEKREVKTADGKSHLVPYVGPLKIQFQDRFCFAGAVVLGDQPLLGAIPLEDMDLVIHPATRKLSVNPQSPNIPAYFAM